MSGVPTAGIFPFSVHFSLNAQSLSERHLCLRAWFVFSTLGSSSSFEAPSLSVSLSPLRMFSSSLSSHRHPATYTTPLFHVGFQTAEESAMDGVVVADGASSQTTVPVFALFLFFFALSMIPSKQSFSQVQRLRCVLWSMGCDSAALRWASAHAGRGSFHDRWGLC